MPILSIDIETYSDVDLTKCGVYAYSDSPNFEILLFAYAFDEKPTQIVDLACGEQLPERVLAALEDPAVTKAAFNAQFERTCISKYLGRKLSPEGWQCTAVQSAMLALPLSLDNVGEVLNIQRKKLKEGADLVRFFSMPCKPTKANGGRTRNRPEDAPEKWERFKTYCIRDVDAEREIRQKLWKFPIPESEMELYRMDQEINDRGILVDQQLVENAVLCDNQYRQMVTARAYELTGLSNPNSPAQIKGWLAEHGVEAEKLDKKTVKGLISETDGEVLEVLKLRLLMAKTSVKKYEAIERSVCSDGRVHGLLQFYGANRTGRWAGRLVQVQNLPQNHIPDLDLARSLVKEQRFEDLDLLYDSTPEVLSELIRTAFVPKPGCRFIVADFSAIEARVLAWFAGEQWRLHTFRGGRRYLLRFRIEDVRCPGGEAWCERASAAKGENRRAGTWIWWCCGCAHLNGRSGYGHSGGRTAAACEPVEKLQSSYHKVLVGGGRSGSKGREGADGGGARKPVLYLPIRHFVCYPPLWPEAVLHQAPDDSEPVRPGEPFLRRCRGKQKVDAD